MVTLPEYLNSPRFSGFSTAQSLVFCVEFVEHCHFFICQFYYRSFDLRLLFTAIFSNICTTLILLYHFYSAYAYTTNHLPPTHIPPLCRLHIYDPHLCHLRIYYPQILSIIYRPHQFHIYVPTHMPHMYEPIIHHSHITHISAADTYTTHT